MSGTASSPSFSLGPGPGSGLGTILLVPMMAQLQAVLTAKNLIRYKTEPPTPLPAAEPPLQSPATTAAIANLTEQFDDYETDFGAKHASAGTRGSKAGSEQGDMSAAAKKAAQESIRVGESRVKILRDKDKLALDTYARAENSLNIYRDICAEFSVALGELGPTGTLKDKIFGGEKKTLGPDPTIHVRIHELFTALESLKVLHKMENLEALEIFTRSPAVFPRKHSTRSLAPSFRTTANSSSSSTACFPLPPRLQQLEKRRPPPSSA